MFKELAVFLLTLDTISAECYYIEAEHAYSYDVNGIYYIYDYDMQCDGRNIYRHLDRELYLYHINGWWVVHHQYCTDEGITLGRVRGHDSSWTPEMIIEIWEENAGNVWQINALFDVDCYYGPSALSTIAIVCISIACFIAAAAIITLPIVLCLRQGQSSRSTTPDPTPAQPATTAFVEVVQEPRDQPPGYETLTPPTVIVNTNIDTKS